MRVKIGEVCDMGLLCDLQVLANASRVCVAAAQNIATSLSPS